MRRFALPLLLCAVLAGRAAAQPPDSLLRRTDSLASESLRRADSISRASAREAEEASRAADSTLRASTARRRLDPPARWADSLRFGRRVLVEGATRDRPDSAARREGTFVSLVRDTVIFRPDLGDSMAAVSLRDVRGLWVSGGRRTRGYNAAAGALLGAAVSSFAVMIANGRAVRAGSSDVPALGSYMGPMVLGAGVGLAVGLGLKEGEDWHRVWPPEDRE